jgi:hypothetical protein
VSAKLHVVVQLVICFPKTFTAKFVIIFAISLLSNTHGIFAVCIVGIVVISYPYAQTYAVLRSRENAEFAMLGVALSAEKWV